MDKPIFMSLRYGSFSQNLDGMKELWMTVSRVPMHMALGTASIPRANLWQIKAFSKIYWVIAVIRREDPLKYLTHSPLWLSLNQYINRDNRKVYQSFI